MRFLSRIPLVDVQSAWALLLHCAGGHPNHMLRAVRFEMVRGFAEGHNAGSRTCLCNILNVVVDGDRQHVATMPLSPGGLGLRDAVRTSCPAFWAGRTALPRFGQGILMWLHSSCVARPHSPTHSGVSTGSGTSVGRCGRVRAPFMGRFGEWPTPSAT